MILISRAFRHQFVIPDFPGFTKYIEEFYWRCKANTEGKVSKGGLGLGIGIGIGARPGAS